MLSIILASALIFGGVNVNSAYGVSIPFKQYKMIVSHTATNYKTTISVFARDEESAASMATLNGWQLIALEEIPVVGNLEENLDSTFFSITPPSANYNGYSSIMPMVDVPPVGISTPPTAMPTTTSTLATTLGTMIPSPQSPSLNLVAEVYFKTGTLTYEDPSQLNSLPVATPMGTAKGNVQYFVVGYAEVGFLESEPANMQTGVAAAPPLASSTQALSIRRANKVVAYLTSNGVPLEQITAVGYGSTFPAYTDSYYKPTSNRRVEVYTYE